MYLGLGEQIVNSAFQTLARFGIAPSSLTHGAGCFLASAARSFSSAVISASSMAKSFLSEARPRLAEGFFPVILRAHECTL